MCKHCVTRPLLGLVIGQAHQVAVGGEKGDRKTQNIIIYIHVCEHRILACAVKKEFMFWVAWERLPE